MGETDGVLSERGGALQDVQVAVAHAVGAYPDQDLSGTRNRPLALFDRDPTVRFVDRRCPHAISLSLDDGLNPNRKPVWDKARGCGTAGCHK